MVILATMPRNKPHSEAINNAKNIAHRGAHSNRHGIIENTKQAFDLAYKSGCWGIEFDVHATADDVLVVNHDPTLKRLWRREGVISQLTFAELRQLVPQIPTLAEIVVEYAAKMHLFIELKSLFTSEEVLVTTLSSLTPCKNYHLLTLDASVFAALNQFPKSCLLLVSGHNNVKTFCDLSLMSLWRVLASYLLLRDKYITQLQGADQKLRRWLC